MNDNIENRTTERKKLEILLKEQGSAKLFVEFAHSLLDACEVVHPKYPHAKKVLKTYLTCAIGYVENAQKIVTHKMNSGE